MLSHLQLDEHIQLIAIDTLKHIESYSKKRVQWLVNKIVREQIWKKPLCIEKDYHLVMDGQHRLESAKIIGLNYLPCIIFNYLDIKIWSLRDDYYVDHDTVIARSLNHDIYPYKTVKHQFPCNLPQLNIPLNELIYLTKEKE